MRKACLGDYLFLGWNVRVKLVSFSKSWEVKTSLPLAILGFLYLLAYAFQVIFWDNHLVQAAAEATALTVWIIFALDTSIKFLGAKSVFSFLRGNFLEIVTLVIPFMRILRVFRIILALRGLQSLIRSRFERTGLFVIMLIPLVWFTGAIAILDVERGQKGASINSLGDAMWWSLTTLSTVGYGDIVPSTTDGRFIAALLLISGVGLVSAGAGLFASWILGEARQSESRQSPEHERL
jgi:voltage-gated potassium channel